MTLTLNVVGSLCGVDQNDYTRIKTNVNIKANPEKTGVFWN